jgi:cation-transporting ATPase E
VTPQQKRELIRGLKKNGHTACMTGDGVNDILAMREADCSVAMVGGSDAARSASDFVLITDDFSVMIDVLKEGRRVINNIEKVAAIFLLKTVYSVLLTLIYIFIPYPYPIAPLQMMPINELTIGIPSFFLALQANYSRPEGKLLTNILEHTIPAAITVVFNSLYIQLASILFHIPTTESSTMVVFLIGIMGFYQLAKLAKPYTQRIRWLLIGLVCSFVLCFALLGNLFMLSSLFSRNVFFYMPLVYFSYHVHSFLGNICRKAVEAFHILKTAGWLKRSVRE